MKSHLRILASLVLAAAAAAPASSRGRDDAPPERTIPVSAKRFAFEPNEIHIRKGEAVTLAVTSQDVTHGFFSRPLHFDEDLAPGKTVHVRIAPPEAGTYTVICDHFCGSGHGGMKMTIVVE
jgi:cytochrome c oxidase subunit II